MTLATRNLVANDLPIVDTILAAAYGYPGRWRDVRRYLSLQPDGWLLAELDGQPVGVGGALDYGACAYVGLVGVIPAAQRRGVGRAIMERLLSWLEGRGVPVVLLDASEAGAPLYLRLGFVEDAEVSIFLRESGPSDRSPSPCLAPMRGGDLDEVVAFDTPIFGGDRRRVLAEFLGRSPERAFVARDAGGRVAGYLLAQPQNLGPWVAASPESAEDLLAAALSLPFEPAPRVLAPGANPAVRELLCRHGFAAQRSLRHMRRGGDRPPGRRELLYGQESLAIG